MCIQSSYTIVYHHTLDIDAYPTVLSFSIGRYASLNPTLIGCSKKLTRIRANYRKVRIYAYRERLGESFKLVTITYLTLGIKERCALIKNKASVLRSFTSLRKEGEGPSYLNFIQTKCHKRDKKLLL